MSRYCPECGCCEHLDKPCPNCTSCPRFIETPQRSPINLPGGANSACVAQIRVDGSISMICQRCYLRMDEKHRPVWVIDPTFDIAHPKFLIGQVVRIWLSKDPIQKNQFGKIKNRVFKQFANTWIYKVENHDEEIAEDCIRKLTLEEIKIS